MRRFLLIGALLLAVGAYVAPAQAQEDPSCTLLCTPEVEFEPTVAVEPIFGGADVRDLRTRTVTSAEPTATFEIVGAVGIPTTIPRTELTGEVIWSPFANTGANPFTGRSANDLGVDAIDDNPVELEFELNFMLLPPEQTGGWAEVHVDVVDQFSPAEQPDDTGTYTHKLNLELDAALLPFQRMERVGFLRGVEIEGSLDYMATGIPREGDIFGSERFLEDASPWGVSMVLVLPLAPL